MTSTVRTLLALALLFLAAIPARAQSPAAPGAAPQTAERETQTQEPAAEPAPSRVSPRYDSPRSAMFTFLEAMERFSDAPWWSAQRDEAMAPIRRAIDFSKVGPDAQRTVATELLGVLNRIGRIEPGDLPGRAHAEQRDLSEYVFFPDPSDPDHQRLLDAGAEGEIVFARAPSGEWRFNAETAANIGDLYRSVEDVPVRYGADERSMSVPLRLRSMMPASLQEREFLAVELWQWIGVLAIVFIAVVADFLLQILLRAGAVRRYRRRGHKPPPQDLLRKSVRPFGLFAGALLALFLFRALGLPPLAQQVLFTAARFVLIVAGVLAAFRVVDLATDLLRQKAEGTETKVDDLLVPLLRKTSKIFITAVGLIYLAESLSIEILPLLTGLGIGGLAVAFAAKDTIENFFGSVAVILDRPFEVGDWVKIDDVEGTVEELGFRSTRVRTFYNSQITMPNAALVRATVDNFGRRRYRRFSATISVAYNTPPEKIDAFCEGVRELIRSHPYTRKDFYQVQLTEFAAASLNIMLYVFHETPDWATELRERHRLMLDIIRLAHRLNVEFAFPTQTLYLKRGHDMPEGVDDSPAEDSAERDIETGRRVARRLIEDADWRRRAPGPVTFETGANSENVDEDRVVEQRRGEADED